MEYVRIGEQRRQPISHDVFILYQNLSSLVDQTLDWDLIMFYQLKGPPHPVWGGDVTVVVIEIYKDP